MTTTNSSANRTEQHDELEALESIFGADFYAQVPTAEDADPVGRLTVRMQLPFETAVLPVPSIEGLKEREVAIEHLPPIIIHFAMKRDYPSDALLNFSLSCEWLPVPLRRKLLQELNVLCQSLQGSVVLFSIAQFIADEAIGVLNLLDGNMIRIPFDSPTDTLTFIDSLVVADRDRAEYLFSQSSLQCGICLESKLGENCFQFPDCKHAFCVDCLNDYFTIHIMEGQVTQVTCPNASCKKLAPGESAKSMIPLPASTLAKIVSPSLLQRYSSLLETHHLLQQPNLTYCPRKTCNAPTLKDPEEEKLCVCSKCGYAFCFFCNRTWHGYASYCQIRHLETIAKEYTVASDHEKRVLEVKYGKKVLERVVREIEEDRLNKTWIQENAQVCPHCTCLVERTEGCCHMVCKVCDVHFCFVCGEKLNRSNPYAHFNTKGTSCFGKLFHGTVPGEYNPADDPAVMGEIGGVERNEGVVVEQAVVEEYVDVPYDILRAFLHDQ
ncbi:UNVERIFIED_CONTAM: E3 ubiquitin-protein ligase rnf14 [Siphonaria sp. JEL0065]|nr:E3 ubiquitin-protein ligase rnf14 [Siphonaria sp. JEL0065]